MLKARDYTTALIRTSSAFMISPNIKVMNSPPTSMKFFTASPDLGAIEHYFVSIIYEINQ